MKTILVISDGMADRPLKTLGGKTKSVNPRTTTKTEASKANLPANS